MVFRLQEESYHYLSNNYYGICKNCGSTQDSCEPDARGYKCEKCESKSVYGIDELLLMGQITLIDNDEEENVSW